MVDKYSIIVWLKRQWGLYKKYWKTEPYILHDRLGTDAENKVGRIALQSIQTLIKMKHFMKHRDEHHKVFLMDGNADNYMELDDVVLDKEEEYLVTTAKRLLKYGG